MAALLMVAGAMAQETSSLPATAPKTNRVLLERAGNTYFYGDKKMNRYQMLDWYAQQNCKVAYDGFRSGFKLATAGWICFGLGLGCSVAGVGCIIGSGITATQASSGQPLPPLAYAGAGLAYAGAALEVASIPCLIVGYVRMHRSVDTYNTHMYSRNPQPYFALQTSYSGLGLALHF